VLESRHRGELGEDTLAEWRAPCGPGMTWLTTTSRCSPAARPTLTAGGATGCTRGAPALYGRVRMVDAFPCPLDHAEQFEGVEHHERIHCMKVTWFLKPGLVGPRSRAARDINPTGCALSTCSSDRRNRMVFEVIA
jgi:hypothetical protein